MKAILLAGVLLLSGCAELTRPPPPEPPVELVGRISASPLPDLMDQAAANFDGAGAGLQGRPAATALAVARLEWISAEFSPGRRLARLPDSFRFGMERAVAEGRSVIGIKPDATHQDAVGALLGAARAISAGEAAGMRAAFANPVFLTEGRPLESRLRQPGAFPDAALATAALREEYMRLMAEGRADRRLVFDDQTFGLSTTGLGSASGR